MAEVRLQEGESIDNALRRFKRKVQAEEIIKEVKRHSMDPNQQVVFYAENKRLTINSQNYPIIPNP